MSHAVTDYPLDTICTKPIAYEEMVAYEALNVAYDAITFVGLRLFWKIMANGTICAFGLRYP